MNFQKTISLEYEDGDVYVVHPKQMTYNELQACLRRVEEEVRQRQEINTLVINPTDDLVFTDLVERVEGFNDPGDVPADVAQDILRAVLEFFTGQYRKPKVTESVRVVAASKPKRKTVRNT